MIGKTVSKFSIIKFLNTFSKTAPQRPLGRWGRDPNFTWRKVDHENMNHCGGPLCGKPEHYSKSYEDSTKSK